MIYITFILPKRSMQQLNLRIIYDYMLLKIKKEEHNNTPLFYKFLNVDKN